MVLSDHHSDRVRVVFVPWLGDEDAAERLEGHPTFGDRHTGFLENPANVFGVVGLPDNLDLLFERITGVFKRRGSDDIG